MSMFLNSIIKQNSCVFLINKFYTHIKYRYKVAYYRQKDYCFKSKSASSGQRTLPFYMSWAVQVLDFKVNYRHIILLFCHDGILQEVWYAL